MSPSRLMRRSSKFRWLYFKKAPSLLLEYGCVTSIKFTIYFYAFDGAQSSNIAFKSNQNKQITAKKAVDSTPNLVSTSATHPGRTCQPGSGSCG